MVLFLGRLPKKAQVLQCHLMNSPGFGVATRIPSKPQLCPHLTPSRKAWSGWNLRYYPGRFLPCFVYKHKKAADLLRNLRIGVERKKGEKRSLQLWPGSSTCGWIHRGTRNSLRGRAVSGHSPQQRHLSVLFIFMHWERPHLNLPKSKAILGRETEAKHFVRRYVLCLTRN